MPTTDYKIYPAEMPMGVLGLREALIHADCVRCIDGSVQAEIKAIFVELLGPKDQRQVIDIYPHIRQDCLDELTEKVKSNYLHDCLVGHRAEGEVLAEVGA